MAVRKENVNNESWNEEERREMMTEKKLRTSCTYDTKSVAGYGWRGEFVISCPANTYW